MRTASFVLVLILASTPAFAQSTSGASSSVSISNPANTDSKNRLLTVPTVVAPGLAAAGVETCLGSATGGMSLMGFGITFGRTTPDEGCHIRLTARQLFAFGFHKAAVALMCQDSRVAEAMAASGERCGTFAAEVRQQRRRKFSTGVTGSIDQPGPADLLAIAPKKKAAQEPTAARSPRVVAKPWRNPDLAVAQVSPPDTVPVISQEEVRWFARMTTTY